MNRGEYCDEKIFLALRPNRAMRRSKAKFCGLCQKINSRILFFCHSFSVVKGLFELSVNCQIFDEPHYLYLASLFPPLAHPEFSRNPGNSPARASGIGTTGNPGCCGFECFRLSNTTTKYGSVALRTHSACFS